jgi:hypothetical protein
VPDDGSYELKHVAPCCVTLKCYLGRCITAVCDTEKNSTGCIGIKTFKKPPSPSFTEICPLRGALIHTDRRT